MAAKGPFSQKDLERSVNSGKFEAVYFFHGTEEHRMKQAISTIKSAIMKGSDPSTAWRTYDLAETSFGEILGDLKTVSFFQERRCVLVEGLVKKSSRGGGQKSETDDEADDKEAKKIRLDEKEQEALLDYAQNPSPDVVLVVACGKVDGRAKFWKELSGKTFSAQFETTEKDRRVMIAEKLQTSGMQFAPDAREWMVERFANRLSLLDSELRKLELYLGGAKKVALADLEACTSAPPLDSIFMLTDSIAAGNMDDSLEALNSLRRQGEILLIVQGMIVRQFRILLVLRSCREQKIGGEETAKRCNVKYPFPYQKYEELAAKFTMEQLKKSICALSMADSKIKSSGLDEWHVMEHEIIALISAKQAGRKPAPPRSYQAY